MTKEIKGIKESLGHRVPMEKLLIHIGLMLGVLMGEIDLLAPILVKTILY